MRAWFDYCLKLDVIATLRKSCGNQKCLWRHERYDPVEKTAPSSSEKKLVFSVNQVVNCQNMTIT